MMEGSSNPEKELRPADFTRRFNRIFGSDGLLQEYAGIAKEYYSGLGYIWGSTVYGRLAESPNIGDVDFIGERPIRGKSLERDDEWVGRLTSVGTIFFERETRNGAEVIDINYLNNLVNDIANPTIDDHLRRKDNFIYNVQNIVYDLKHRRIRGHVGMKAINTRVLKFHSLSAAIIIAEREIRERFPNKKITPEMMAEKLEELMKEKADQLDFGYKMPSNLNDVLTRRYA